VKQPPPELAERLWEVSDRFLALGSDVKVDELAEMSGVPRATIYYYFSGKDDVMAFLLTQKVEGKTRSRYVSPEQAPVVRRQIESGRQFRERVEAYWEACERWADEQLEAIPVSAKEAEKGGSPRTWKAKSPRKSKRS